MTKIEIDNEKFEVIRESINNLVVCKKCYFYCHKCPPSDEWPNALCNDYEDDNTVAYFKKIE